VALFERVGEVLFEGIGGKVLLGIGAVIVAPAVLPAVRPVTKQLIKGGLYLTDKAKALGGEAKAQAGELVSEAKAEDALLPMKAVADVAPSATVSVGATPAPVIERGVIEQIPAEQVADVQVADVDEQAEPPWRHLQQIPDFNESIARQAWEKGLRTFEDVRKAAENDQLIELQGIGKARQARILEWLQGQSSV